MSPPNKSDKPDRLICLCNSVPKSSIEAAIERGCNSLGKLFDATLAGVGACGGSCQPTLRNILETYRLTGKFPENPSHPSKSQRDKALKRKQKPG
jgi:bacterioferritin-associated ferredoxin